MWAQSIWRQQQLLHEHLKVCIVCSWGERALRLFKQRASSRPRHRSTHGVAALLAVCLNSVVNLLAPPHPACVM